MAAMQPAYTSIATRQTLSRSAQPPAQQGNDKWSPAVRSYVQRAFGYVAPSITPQEMQEKLKAVLTKAAESDQIATIDWDKAALPHELILHERAHAAAMSHFNAESLNSPSSLPALSVDAAYHMNNNLLGKRKSGELDTGLNSDNGVTPPWKKQAVSKTTLLEDRITGQTKGSSKKQQKKKNGGFTAENNSNSDAAIERRKQRFGVVPINSTSSYTMPSDPVSTGPVLGTCQKLEKRYLRLTAAPKPEEVRPVPVLTEMLSLLRKKWISEHNYAYACDQFKSLRQDLTVQHIQTDFTVKVYEAHARIALEMGDLGEYNQCQTQLRALYKKKLGGRPEEFTAYRLLYFVYTCNRADMNNALADLTATDKQMDGVKHALKVRAAVAAGNYHKFFKLYQETPYMGAYLLDKCLPRQRLAALDTICKTYKPDVPLSFIVDELAFHSEDSSEDPDQGARACVQFICDHGGEQFILKKDDGEIRFLTGKAGKLFEQARRQAGKIDIKGQI